jgi:hypothetical protein
MVFANFTETLVEVNLIHFGVSPGAERTLVALD